MKSKVFAISALKWLLGLSMLALLTLLLVVLLFFDALSQVTLERVVPTLPGTLTVERFSPRATGFRAHGVRWVLPGGREPFFEASRVDVDFSYRSALRRDYLSTIRTVHIRGGGLRAVVDRDGTLNLSKLFSADSTTPRFPLEEMAMRTVLEDCWLLYHDRRGSGFLYEVSELGGEVQFVRGEPARVNLAGLPARDTESGFTLEGQLGLPDPSVNIQLELINLGLLPFAGHPGFGPGLTLIEGRLDLQARARGEAEAWGDLAREAFLVAHGQLRDGLVLTPWMPTSLRALNGSFRLVDRQLSTEGFLGQVADIPFELTARAKLGPGGDLAGAVVTERFPLSRIAEFLAPEVQLSGFGQARVEVSGSLSEPTLSGDLSFEEVAIQDQSVETARASFLFKDQLLYLSNLAATNRAGTVTGEGWIFFSDHQDPRVLLTFESRNAELDEIMPGLAQTLEFEMKVLGSLDNYLVFGSGQVDGIGSWGQGLSTAGGRFVLSGNDLMLLDGTAYQGGSLVRLPFGSFDLQTRHFDGFVSADDFAVSDVPGVEGVQGRFSGRAFVQGDLTGPTPFLQAMGRMTSGEFAVGGETISGAQASLYYDGYQLQLPTFSGRLRGIDVVGAGTVDPRNQAVEIFAESREFDRAGLGLPSGNAQLVGEVRGSLAEGEGVGVYGYVSMPEGEGALSLVARGDRSLTGVVWADGTYETPEYGTVSGAATAVLSGTPEHLAFEYVGDLVAEGASELGPVQLTGSALLNGSVLHLRPNLLLARDHVPDHAPLPWIGYQGVAHPFFGPLLSAPLERVVIEELPFPTSRALSFSGQTDLEQGTLDLEYTLRASGLQEFAAPILREAQGRESGPVMPSGQALQILSGFGTARGAVRGALSSPRVSADFHLPWILLGQGPQRRQGLSLRGDLNILEDALQIPYALLGETPMDPRLSNPTSLRLSGPGLASLSGRWSRSGLFDFRLRAERINSELMTFITGLQLPGIAPYGRLSTEGLRLWGRPGDPNLAGRIVLEDGGMWIHGEPFSLAHAYIDLQSSGRALSLERIEVQGPAIQLSGSGSIDHDGELSGRIDATLPFNEYRRLGGVVSGLDGELEMVMLPRGNAWTDPAVEVGVRGRNLTWNPAVLGGIESTVSIEEFVLGRFDGPDGPFLSGMTIRPELGSVRFAVPEDGFRFKRAEGGAEIQADGSIELSTDGFPMRSADEPFSPLTFMTSLHGPRFGDAERPFRLTVKNGTFREIARLLGRGTVPFDFRTNFALEMRGHWWEDHQRGADPSLPHYALRIEDLEVERASRGGTSGFLLSEPAELAYQRRGDAGFLSFEEVTGDFFREEPLPTDEEGSEPRFERIVRGQFGAEGDLALMELPGAEPVSSAHIGVVDVPMENLAFLLPERLDVGGLIETIELNLTGSLPEPRLLATTLISDFWLGPLAGMTFRGYLSGRPEESGYRISINSTSGEPSGFTFASKDPQLHRIQAEGFALLDWRDDPEVAPPDPDRFHHTGYGRYVSLESPINLTGTIVDDDLEVLAGLVPGEERTSGTFDAHLNVSGTLERPEFEGQASLENGLFDSNRYGRFQALHIDSSVERIEAEQAEPGPVLEQSSSGLITRWSLHRFEGELGGQPFFGQGKAELAGIRPTFLEMFFVGEALPVTLPPMYSGQTNVELELTGQTEQRQGRYSLRPLLRGAFSVPAGTFQVPINPFGSSSPGGGVASLPSQLPFDVDLNVSLGQEFYLEALGSSVRVVGDLRLLTEGGEPKVYGRTELTRGVIRIPFYEGTFRVRQGVAIFDGPLIPRLEAVQAVADMGGYRLIAQVSGRYPDSLTIDLISDPPLPQQELSRMVIMGGLPSQLTGEPNRGAGLMPGQEMAFLSGALTNRLTDEIGRFLMMSEVSFDFIPPASYVIKLAKALDPHDRVLFTLTRVIRDDGYAENLFGLEWRFAENFLTRIAFDEYARARFWFQSITRF